MKTSRVINLLLPGLALAAGLAVARAAADDTKTVTGEAKCAKMDLKSQDACQTVIQVREGDKVVTYFVADNDLAREFHKAVCGHPQKVTATGKVNLVKGKSEFVATKIEVVK